MESRNLGASGLRVTAVSYGNWLTHGSQVEEDAALACVRRALDEGITTFDTADVYAEHPAETVLGKALTGERREGLEIFTKVFWPIGPRSQRPRPVTQAHPRVDRRFAAAPRHRLRRPLPGAPLRPRDAARGDDAGLRRRRPRRQGALHRRLGVARRGDPCCARAGPGAQGPAGLQPAAVQHPVAGHRVRGGAHERGARDRADRLVADRAGRAHRQVQARSGLPGRLPRHRRQGRRRHDQPLAPGRRARAGPEAAAGRRRGRPVALRSWPSPGRCRTPTSPARSSGASRPEQVTENVKAAGVKLDDDVLSAIDEAVGDVVERDAAKTQSPRRSEAFA